MSLGLWNLQWLNHNSQRSYPICDWASKKCNISDDIELPNNFLLAINFAISTALTVNIDQFYISAIAISTHGVTVNIGYKDVSDVVAVSHLPLSDEEVVVGALTGINDFADTVGYIAINPQSCAFRFTPGYYTFDYEATALEPDCIRPMLRSVTSLRIQTSGSYSERMYGDIVLVAGNNIALDIVSSTPERSVIRISAISSEEDMYTQKCGDIDNKEMQCITSINGVTADNMGNVTVNGVGCMEVGGSGNTLVLTDTCAEPCCGCAETNALEAQIERVVKGEVQLNEFINKLVDGVSKLETQILAMGKDE